MPDKSIAVVYPKISVITVCFNSVDVIEGTIKSVLSQDYPDLEYVVIDGESTDGTKKLLERYSNSFKYFLSEPDSGVYDAMNKGLLGARGEYILFMNAGDFFYKPKVLKELIEMSSADVIYGDFNYFSGSRQGIISSDFKKGIFNHQSVLYRRNLHSWFGNYLSVRGLTAADYLFFMSMQSSTKEICFEKVNVVVSSVDPYGVSSGLQTFFQVSMVDGLMQRRGRWPIAVRIVIHPAYNFVRKILSRFI